MAKKSLWQRIKNFFSGDDNKTTKSTKTTKNLTTKQEAQRGYDLKQAYLEREKKKREQEAQQKANISKAINKSKQTTTTNTIAKANNSFATSPKALGTEVTLPKMPKSITDTTGIKVNNNIIQKRKDYTTNGQYDPVKSIRTANKQAPIQSAAFRGAVNGAGGLLIEPLAKTNPKIKKELNRIDKNATTGQKWAKGIGEVAGTMATVGLASSGASAAGKALVGDASEAGTLAGRSAEKLASSGFVKKLAEKTGKDAVTLSSNLINSLSKDLGMHLTVENINSIAAGIDKGESTNGSKEDKLMAGVKEYFAQQALNSAINVGMDVAPIAAKGLVKKLADNSGTLGAKEKPLTALEQALKKIQIEDGDVLAKDIPDEIKAKPTSKLRLNSKVERAELRRRYMSSDKAIQKEAIEKLEKYQANATKRSAKKLAPEAAEVIKETTESKVKPVVEEVKASVEEPKVSAEAELKAKEVLERNKPEIKTEQPNVKPEVNVEQTKAKVEPPKDKIYQEEKWDEFEAARKAETEEPLPNGFEERKYGERFEDDYEVMDETKFSKKTKEARLQAEADATGDVHLNENKRNTTKGEYEVLMKEYTNTLEDGTTSHIQKHVVQMYSGAKTDAARQMIEDGFESGKYVIEEQHDKDMAREAAEWAFEDLDDAAKELDNLRNRRFSKIFQSVDDISKVEWKASVMYDIAQENIDKDPVFFGKIMDDAIKVTSDIGSEWGRVGRVQQMIARSTPEGAEKITETSIKNGLAKNSDYIHKYYGKPSKLAKLKRTNMKEYNAVVDDMWIQYKADNKDVVDALDDIVANPKASSDEIANKTAHAADLAFKKQKKNVTEILTTARYVAMLSSPKTHVRNVIGNVVRGTMGGVSDVVEQGLLSANIKSGKIKKEDLLFRKKFSLDAMFESHSKNPKSEAGKWAKEMCEKHADDIKGLSSIETKVGENLPRNKKIKDMVKDKENILDIASAIEGKALTKEDEISLFARYRSCAIKLRNSLGDTYKNATASQKKGMDAMIHKRALDYAQDATYRATNEWAEQIKRISRYATDASATKAQRTLGMIVNTVMPFAQTPANVVKTILDFSPKGFVQGSSAFKEALNTFEKDMAKATTESQKRQARIAFTMAVNEAVELKAKGITGSGLILIGALAGALATDEFHFNTNLGNDSESKVRKDWGEQDYSLTFTTPDGKQVNMTLDWLSPTATSLFMGVQLGQTLNDIFIEKDFKFSSLPTAALAIGSRIIEPTMDTTMFQSLKTTLESVQNMNRYSEEGDEKIDPITAIGFQLALNYAGQFSPSVLQQITRACAKGDYLITGKNNTNYQINSLIAKTPAAGLFFGSKTNGWGEIKNERNEDNNWLLETGGRFLKFGVLPANVNTLTSDKTDKELLKLAKKTGDWDIMPMPEYNTSLSIGRNPDDKNEYELNSKEMSVYNQAKTKSGEDCMKAALDSVIFNRYEKQGTKKVFVEGYTDEEKQKLIEWSKGKTAKQVVKKLLDDEYYKKATDAEKTKMLITVLDSATDDARGAKRTSQLEVAKMKGMSEDEYNFKNELTETQQKNAKQYIDSGLLTEADFVNFERSAGKKYYYEDENGGYVKVGFNKGEMYDALNSEEFANLSDEQKAALFNTYKSPTAKSYGSSSSGGWGYRRGGSSKSSNTNKTAKVSVKKTSSSSSKYQDMGKAITKSHKSSVPSLKTNYTDKIKPPEAKW